MYIKAAKFACTFVETRDLELTRPLALFLSKFPPPVFFTLSKCLPVRSLEFLPLILLLFLSFPPVFGVLKLYSVVPF